MSDERWNQLFAALRSNRDRAIVALAISNGARASELLGMKGVDVDWGDQLVRVVRKGAQAEQWLPASAEASQHGSSQSTRLPGGAGPGWGRTVT